MTAPKAQPAAQPVAPVAEATVLNLRESRKQTAAAKKAPATRKTPAKATAAKAPAKKAEPKPPSELQRRQALSEGIVRASWEIPMARVRELAGIPDLTDKEITAQLDRHMRYLSRRCYTDQGKRAKQA